MGGEEALFWFGPTMGYKKSLQCFRGASRKTSAEIPACAQNPGVVQKRFLGLGSQWGKKVLFHVFVVPRSRKSSAEILTFGQNPWVV